MTLRRTTAAAVCALLGVLAGTSACSGDDADSPTSTARSASSATPTSSAAPTTTTPSAPANASARLLDSVCGGAPVIDDLGTVASDELVEISGIGASRLPGGGWWAHNDSGDSARLFSLDEDGGARTTVELAGVEARDWEELVVVAVDGGTPQIFVGDIGDNAGTRDEIRIHRLDEPAGDVARVRADRLTLTYPDGPHDAEAFLVDPVGGELVVITKDWSMSGTSDVYRAPADLADGSTTELEHVGRVTLPAATLVTAADVSPDGSVVALRSYGAVHLFPREQGQPLWSAFDAVPCEGPVPSEQQGEAIAFTADGGAYVTVSEGEHPVLHRTGPG